MRAHTTNQRLPRSPYRDSTDAAYLAATLARLGRAWINELDRILAEADARVTAYEGKADP